MLLNQLRGVGFIKKKLRGVGSWVEKYGRGVSPDFTGHWWVYEVTMP
jgi:hypothetical protein